MDKLIITPVTSSKSIAILKKLVDQIRSEDSFDASDLCKKSINEAINRITRGLISEQIQKGYLYFLVRNTKGASMGYFGVLVKEDELFLETIYLTLANRRKKYGKRIMKFIEWLSKKKGCLKITTLVDKINTDAVDFFQANKFYIPHFGDFEADSKGVQYYEMEKMVLTAGGLSYGEWLEGEKYGQEESEE